VPKRTAGGIILIYEGRYKKKTYFKVVLSGTNCIPRPIIVRTARPRRLYIKGASCWPATRRVGTCAIWPAAAAAAALYKTRALWAIRLPYECNLSCTKVLTLMVVVMVMVAIVVMVVMIVMAVVVVVVVVMVIVVVILREKSVKGK
jgi:hypothetical protein